MRKKIMVVDDDPDVRYTMKLKLEKIDDQYTVIPVESGMQCLELLKKNEIPDLILLDIMMPEMSGWEIYNKLKEKKDWSGIPVVFLTARTDRMAENAGGFLGDDYIEKPCDVLEIKERIDKVLKNTSQ
jgi:CheY-like chemotaxis protein